MRDASSTLPDYPRESNKWPFLKRFFPTGNQHIDYHLRKSELASSDADHFWDILPETGLNQARELCPVLSLSLRPRRGRITGCCSRLTVAAVVVLAFSNGSLSG